MLLVQSELLELEQRQAGMGMGSRSRKAVAVEAEPKPLLERLLESLLVSSGGGAQAAAGKFAGKCSSRTSRNEPTSSCGRWHCRHSNHLCCPRSRAERCTAGVRGLCTGETESRAANGRCGRWRGRGGASDRLQAGRFQQHRRRLTAVQKHGPPPCLRVEDRGHSAPPIEVFPPDTLQPVHQHPGAWHEGCCCRGGLRQSNTHTHQNMRGSRSKN